MRRFPVLLPLSLFMGATPTRAAIFLRSREPSSGHSASKLAAAGDQASQEQLGVRGCGSGMGANRLSEVG